MSSTGMVSSEDIPYHISCLSLRSSMPSRRNSSYEQILKGIGISDQQIPHGIYIDLSTSTMKEVEIPTTPILEVSFYV
ncbi:hypothetical protein GIB67_005328 [Kingdonia uniflora]|uniref:Uncharacterized protein n=1 Tax=Kingdonia uniflora TaxID=39325 RepID=A0A7J7NCH7_9MAGN|nr:hypothetical protein GIB67_005328 [Kingdonia uniflora]